MRYSTAAKLALAVSVGARAFAQHVHTDSDPAANFGSYKTFAWKSEKIDTPDPALNNPLVQSKIHVEIENQLKARGLKLAQGNPDIWISYRFGTGIERQVIDYPFGGWRWGGWARDVVFSDKGTLVLDVADGARQQMVWRAVCVDLASSGVKLDDHLPKDVQRAFDQFPIKKIKGKKK
jgi:hypothetical protein